MNWSPFANGDEYEAALDAADFWLRIIYSRLRDQAQLLKTNEAHL